MRSVPRSLVAVVIAVAALVLPAESGHAASDDDYTFTPTFECTDPDSFTFKLEVAKAGDPEAITVVFGDPNGFYTENATVGVQTFQNTGTYFEWLSIKVEVGGVPIYESGKVVATSAQNCGIPLPPDRTDLGFNLTAECGDNGAEVTITVTGTDIDVVIRANGPAPFEDHLTGNGPVQTTFTMPYDEEFTVAGYDPFDRLVYESGYRIATAEYCVQPSVIASMWVECNDNDQPALNVSITHFYQKATVFEVYWYLDGQSSAVTPELTQGVTYQSSLPLTVGVAVEGTITYPPGIFARVAANLDETIAPDCTPAPTTTSGSGGAGPTTTAARGLPGTGQGSNSVAVLAAALLAGGAALIRTTRRRTA